VNFTFRIRVADMGLFDKALWTAPNPGSGKGQPEADARRNRFAKRAVDDVWAITLDDVGLDLLAEEMELDGEGAGFAFHRYAQDGHREKAAGIGGSTLGDIGEILVWLTHRFAGRRLVRVVGYRAWNPNGAGPFPQPDFLVYDAATWALEVKSSQAFDYRALRTRAKVVNIAGCDPLNDARTAALPQLGFDPANHNPQTIRHYLRANIGGLHNVVAFPCSKGVATAVLVRDARVGTLEAMHVANTNKFTPKAPCAGRSCWDCFSSPNGAAHAAIVEMPNEPGKLLLPGLDAGRAWFERYSRWAAVLRARDPLAASQAEVELRREPAAWLERLRRDDNTQAVAAWLAYVWDQYPSDAAYDHGLTVERRIADVPNDDWRISVGAPQFPLVEGSTADAVAEELRRVDQRAASFSIDFRDSQVGTLVVHRTAQGLRVELASQEWWTGARVDDDVAARIAESLWSVASPILGFDPIPAPPVKRVEAIHHTGDKVLLGWASPVPLVGQDDDDWYRYWWQSWRIFGPFRRDFAPFARMRLRVAPDGRAAVSVSPWNGA
jgi:hypothetical protein